MIACTIERHLTRLRAPFESTRENEHPSIGCFSVVTGLRAFPACPFGNTGPWSLSDPELAGTHTERPFRKEKKSLKSSTALHRQAPSVPIGRPRPRQPEPAARSRAHTRPTASAPGPETVHLTEGGPVRCARSWLFSRWQARARGTRIRNDYLGVCAYDRVRWT